MGLLNFVKEAGEKIWDAVSGDSKEDRAEKLKKHIDGLNLPGAEKVNIDVAEDQRIFEANKPMLTHPDKIYPGQVLIIPAK